MKESNEKLLIKKGLLDWQDFYDWFTYEPKEEVEERINFYSEMIEDRMEDIRPCICCHNACFNMTHYKGVANDQDLYDTMHISRCALDPQVMQSTKYKITPAKKIKNIAVIGGGIGGMEAAILCAKRGHTVTLYEKTDSLGGGLRKERQAWRYLYCCGSSVL